jgi:hypothetical protein
MLVALPVRRLWVECRGTRSGRVAAAPPACGWLVGRSHGAGCARGTLCLRRAPVRPAGRGRAVAPPMPPWTPPPAGTGRCTPPPNPNPGFRAAGHRIRTGHNPPESVQATSRRPLPSADPNQQPSERGQATPGKYVMPDPDRVNCGEGEHRRPCHGVSRAPTGRGRSLCGQVHRAGSASPAICRGVGGFQGTRSELLLPPQLL